MLLLLLKGFQARLNMMNGWTVITDHDLRRQKKTDDRTLLSMGKHRPVATQMSRSLTKVRDRMLEGMVQKDNLEHDMTANAATMVKCQAFNHVFMNIYIVKDTTNFVVS